MKQLFGLLLLVGLVIAYWQWVLVAVVVVLAVKAAPVAWRELQAEQAADRRRVQGLIVRADQQHLWSMSGDPRGVHGDYPPAFEGTERPSSTSYLLFGPPPRSHVVGLTVSVVRCGTVHRRVDGAVWDLALRMKQR
jgi:hypothetical protein